MKRFNRFAATGLAVLIIGVAAAQGQQAGAPKQGQVTPPVGQPGTTFGGITQAPFFANPTVRTQLNLNADQYNALNNAYREALSHYNAILGQVSGNNLTDAQRAQKVREAQTIFYQNLNGSVDRLVTDPQQRQRYNQLHLQYQGYSAFNDPVVQQKLNLTDDQRQKLAQYTNEWNQQMAGLQNSFQTDPTAATAKYNQLLQQNNQRLNSVLNQQQQQMWQQMTGAPYNFPPGVYFQRVGG